MPNRPKADWAGKRQGHLLINKSVGSNKYGQSLWECVCDCGSTTVKSVVFLNNGGQCCSRACIHAGKYKHGAASPTNKSKEYRTWQDMKRRCYKPNAPMYKHYGGRGITVCARWIDSFENFLTDMGECPEGKRMSIDRIDVNGNYEPSNCRWATPAEQIANRRSKAEIKADLVIYEAQFTN